MQATKPEFAAAATTASERKGEPIGGAVLASYRHYLAVEAKGSSRAYPKLGWPLTGHATNLGDPFDAREHALTWTRLNSQDADSLQFKDIGEARPPEHHYGIWFIPIRRTDGTCLLVNVTNRSDRVVDQAPELEDPARSALLAGMSPPAQSVTSA